MEEVGHQKPEQDNRDTNDREFDCIAHDLRPMELLCACTMQDGGLQDEELYRNQDQENKRDRHLRYGGFTGRDKAVECCEQHRVESGQKGKSAWSCQELPC